MRSLLAVMALACLWWACAATRPSEREDRLRCGTLDLFPPVLSPSRPYRVLGPISATDRSEQGLREVACRAGADAVIDVRRESVAQTASSLGSGTSFEDSVTFTGTAIVYTDQAGALGPTTGTPVGRADAGEASPPPPQ